MAMIHQWPLQETSPNAGDLAEDVISGISGLYEYKTSFDYAQNETFSSNPNLKSVLLNTQSTTYPNGDPTDAPDRTKEQYIDLLSSNNASGLQIPYTGDRSIFVFFRPSDDNYDPGQGDPTNDQQGYIFRLVDSTTGSHPNIQALYYYEDEFPLDTFNPHGEIKYIQFGITADNVTGGTATINLDPNGITTDREQPWYIVGITWNTTQATFHLYNFDTDLWTHITDDNSGNGYAMPSGNFDTVLFGSRLLKGTVNFEATLLSGWMSHISIFDTALTDAEVEAQTFNPPASALPCSTTFNASELASMRAAAAQIMTCLAEVQEQSLAGNWITIATNVPCNIEISGVRRELDSSDNEVVFQSWLVSLAGTVTLPAPTDNKTIRIIVGGLTLQTFQYYQSPDDIVIPLECEEV
jgi:hypothetical protein